MTRKTTSGRESTIDKVRALLAKSTNSDYPAESEAFQAKAQALITRHQIVDAELEETDPSMRGDEIEIDGWGNATRGVVHLYGGVGDLNRCSSAHRTKRGAASVFIHGRPLDLAFTRMLVEHLLPQLRSDLLADRPRSRMSYAMGWAHQVVDRLQAAQEAEAQAAKALVPTNLKASEHLNQARRVRKAPTTPVDGWEYQSGTSAGDQVDLGQTKLAADVGPAA